MIFKMCWSFLETTFQIAYLCAQAAQPESRSKLPPHSDYLLPYTTLYTPHTFPYQGWIEERTAIQGSKSSSIITHPQ